MAKNKDKNQDKGKKQAPTGAAATSKEVKKEVTKKEEPKVEDAPKADLKEETPVNAPAADAAGAVETATVEEIPPTSGNVPSVATTVGKILESMPEDGYYSGESEASILNTLERRTARMSKESPLKIKMEAVLDYGLVWAATKLSVQMLEQKKRMGIATKNDEATINNTIEMFNSVGVELEQHPSEDPTKALFTIKEMTGETKEAAEAENKEAAETTGAAPERIVEKDPLKWNNDEEAIEGLYNIGSTANGTMATRFNAQIKAFVEYKTNVLQGKEKEEFLKKGIGELTSMWYNLVGSKGTYIFNSLAGAALNSLKTDENPIFAHCILKKNLGCYSDEEIRDLLQVFIELDPNRSPDTPLDKLPAVVKGIITPDLNRYKTLVEWSEDKAKKVMNNFYPLYKDVVGERGTETFRVKSINKMIEIRNLYVPNAPLATITEAEYPTK